MKVLSDETVTFPSRDHPLCLPPSPPPARLCSPDPHHRPASSSGVSSLLVLPCPYEELARSWIMMSRCDESRRVS
eukprot:614735-Hanusia_phi.AAC.1